MVAGLQLNSLSSYPIVLQFGPVWLLAPPPPFLIPRETLWIIELWCCTVPKSKAMTLRYSISFHIFTQAHEENSRASHTTDKVKKNENE